MASAPAGSIHPDCDLCARKETRFNYALKNLEYVRQKSLEDPSSSDGFALGVAERYVDEVLISHTEHRMPTYPEAEGAQSTKREDYQYESGDQTKEPRERQSRAGRGMNSTADRGEKPSTPEAPAPRSKGDGTDGTPDANTEYALRIAFFNQMDVVDGMVDLERKFGIIAPGGYKQVIALTRLAGAILKEELKRRK